MAEYEAEHGVTNMIPATMTLPGDTLLDILENAGEYREEQKAAGTKETGMGETGMNRASMPGN